MIEILEKILICLSCGCLNAWGGYSFLVARRYIMVSVIAISVSFFSHIWWLGGLCLPDMGAETLAYRWFGQGNFGRAVWLMLQSMILSGGLVLTHHLGIIPYVIWAVGAAIICGILNNRIKQIPGDIIFGTWLSSIVFLIHP